MCWCFCDPDYDNGCIDVVSLLLCGLCARLLSCCHGQIQWFEGKPCLILTLSLIEDICIKKVIDCHGCSYLPFTVCFSDMNQASMLLHLLSSSSSYSIFAACSSLECSFLFWYYLINFVTVSMRVRGNGDMWVMSVFSFGKPTGIKRSIRGTFW